MPENQTSGKMDIEQRLTKVLERVRVAEQTYGRELGSVQVLPVSKTRPAEDIATVVNLGIPGVGKDFGENYLQEAQQKIEQLAERFPNRELNWHFIGPIQSNKTHTIAELFQWVHSVDRLKIARRLSEQRPAGLPLLNICLQVNVSGEASKSGVSVAELPELVEQVLELPNLRLRGLMAIPAATDDVGEQRAAFAAVREAFNSLQKAPHRLGPDWDTLSMGMSGDLEAAIAEGATIVRIGTDIFGPRVPKTAVG